MTEPLDASVDLSIDDALSQVDSLRSSLEDALSSAVDIFSTAFADAASSLPPVAVDADTSAVAPEIDGAISEANGTVPVDADASNIAPEIDDAVASADPAPVPIDADTSNADSAISELGNTAGGATTQTDGLKGSVEGLEGVALLATGSVGGMRTAVQGFGAAGIPAVAGTLAVAGAIGELTSKGIEGASATQRYDTILGKFGEQVRNVKVGNLDTDISSLSLKLGSLPSRTEQSAASLFQLGINSGVAAPKVAQTTDQIIALAARAVALNPALGTVGDVADSMGVRLARGGRFAASFGVSLTAAEINARALADTGKTTAADLTIYEKSAAAAALATDKYGGSLNETVSKGAENATIQQRRFKAELETTLEELGKPLVAPMFDLIQAGLPAVVSLGRVLGTLATSAIPAVTNAVTIVAPVLDALATVIDALGPAIGPVIQGFLAFKAVEGIAAILGLLSTGLLEVAVVAPVAGEAVLAAAADVEAAGVAVESSSGPIGILIGLAGLAAGALGLFGGGADDAASSEKDFTDALIKSNGALDKNTAELLRSKIEADGVGSALQKAGINFNTLGNAVLASKHHLDEFEQSFTVTGASNTVDAQLKRFVAGLREADPALAAVLEKLRQQGQLTPELTNSIIGLANANATATATEKERNAIGSQNLTTTTANAQANDELTKSFADLATSIAVSIPNAAGQFQSFQQSVSSAFNGAIPSVQDFVTNLSDTVSGVANWLSNVRNLLSQNLPGLASLVQSQGAVIGGQLAQQIAAATPATRIAWEQQIETGTFALSQLGIEAPQLATQAANDTVANFQTGIAPLGPAATAAVGQAQGAVANGRGGFQAAGSGTGSAASQGVQEGMSTIPGIASQSVLAAGGPIGSAGFALNGQAYNAGHGVGLNFANGIAGGINSGSHFITEAVTTAVDQAVAAAKGHLKITSPSRVAHDEIGVPFGQGIATGILASSDDVVAAAEELTRAAAGSGIGTLPSAPSSFAGGSGGGGAAGIAIDKIEFHFPGITDSSQASAAGDQAAESFASGLERRRIVIAARTS